MILEVLVKEHLQALTDSITLNNEAEDAAPKQAAITLNHIGAALEWAAKTGWKLSYKEDCWHCLSYNPITTTELVHKYFESLKK